MPYQKKSDLIDERDFWLNKFTQLKTEYMGLKKELEKANKIIDDLKEKYQCVEGETILIN